MMGSHLRTRALTQSLALMLVCFSVLALAQGEDAGPLAPPVVQAAWTSAEQAAASTPTVVPALLLQSDNSDNIRVQTAKPLQRTRSKAVRMAAAQQKMAAAGRTSTAITASAIATTAGNEPSGNGVAIMAMSSIYQTIFDRHNTYRARHQAAALTWSDSLASQAAAYAARCNFAHDAYANAGENLFAVSDTSNPASALTQAIDLWYDEVRMYNFNNPGFSASTGHFTQVNTDTAHNNEHQTAAFNVHPGKPGGCTLLEVVWRGSSAVGCALQSCNNGLGNTNFRRANFVVCRYSPAGNVIGSFPQNVLPASNTPAPQPPPSPANPPPATPPPATPPPATPPPATPPTNPPQVPPATLPSGYRYASPGCLYSANQGARLCMENSGYAVLYVGGVPGRAVWVSPNTLTSSFRPYRLGMGADGNLQVTDNLNRQLWQSGTRGRGVAPYRMVVEDGGAAVIYDAVNVRLWATPV